ncbi:MAG TPA: ABC transporter ATP-binding protein [Gemmatimonadaceae bacterium]|nr:ABC transporter ATP-binding protein [Gemmatimonadaceae bacterium]
MTLTVEHLTRRFVDADRPAVDDMSFTVGKGEVLALVGASGSGKTTTLRMIAGYEQPDGGRIVLDDARGASRDITADSPQRRGFGMVFQHYALFPHMSVAENVAFGLEARGMSRSDRVGRARQALERVGLADAGPRAVQSLSGGEQQRVALARAIVIDPPVLLLDEPLSNLDPARRQETREWLRLKLHELKSIAIFVTHDQEDAFAIADRMAVMREGKLLQIGTADELYRQPTNFHVAQFIGRSTLVGARRDGNRARITLTGVAQDAPIASMPGNAASDAPLTAVVRPEMLALCPPGSPDTWHGRVDARRYAGSHYVYRVSVASAPERSHTFEVLSENGSFAERSEVGIKLLPKPIALLFQ